MKTVVYFLMIIGLAIPVFAQDAPQNEEQITLTTYYPAPYGEYESIASEFISTDTILIGYADSDSEDSGMIKLKPYDDTASIPSGQAGYFYYSMKDEELKIHDGSEWKSSKSSSALGYDMSKVTVYHHQEFGIASVTLVDIIGSGILLGGSVVGAFPTSIVIPGGPGKYTIDMLVDGIIYTIPMKPDGSPASALCEIESLRTDDNDDFSFIPLPSPVKFDNRLIIQYNTINNNDAVTGIAYIYND
jgi:hypothetical protein